MKNFIQKNFTTIVLVITLLSFFKGCGDGRELSKIRKEIQLTSLSLFEIILFVIFQFIIKIKEKYFSMFVLLTPTNQHETIYIFIVSC